MPLEIKELHIKGVISNGSDQQGSSGSGGRGSEEDKQAIIAAAVEKVLQILEDKKSR